MLKPSQLLGDSLVLINIWQSTRSSRNSLLFAKLNIHYSNHKNWATRRIPRNFNVAKFYNLIKTNSDHKYPHFIYFFKIITHLLRALPISSPSRMQSINYLTFMYKYDSITNVKNVFQFSSPFPFAFCQYGATT
jgi:hypothetical protein